MMVLFFLSGLDMDSNCNKALCISEYLDDSIVSCLLWNDRVVCEDFSKPGSLGCFGFNRG